MPWIPFHDQESFENITIQREVIGDPGGFPQGRDGGRRATARRRTDRRRSSPARRTAGGRNRSRIQGRHRDQHRQTAKLETGATVNVPLFVNQDDVIRIDTRDRRYIDESTHSHVRIRLKPNPFRGAMSLGVKTLLMLFSRCGRSAIALVLLFGQEGRDPTRSPRHRFAIALTRALNASVAARFRNALVRMQDNKNDKSSSFSDRTRYRLAATSVSCISIRFPRHIYARCSSTRRSRCKGGCNAISISSSPAGPNARRAFAAGLRSVPRSSHSRIDTTRQRARQLGIELPSPTLLPYAKGIGYSVGRLSRQRPHRPAYGHSHRVDRSVQQPHVSRVSRCGRRTAHRPKDRSLEVTDR